MAKAYKTIIHFTVFSPEPLNLDHANYEGDLYDPLTALIEDTVEGDKIGDWQVISQDEPVEGDALTMALVAIGNDGAFFDGFEDADDFDIHDGRPGLPGTPEYVEPKDDHLTRA